jgi:hypothetical protein
MTDAELRDAAVAALKATTISYPEWKRRVDQGRYADVTATRWWQAFDHLAKIGLAPPPPPAGTFGAALPAMHNRPSGTPRVASNASELQNALNAGGYWQLAGTIVGEFSLTRQVWLESVPGQRATIKGPDAPAGSRTVQPLRVDPGGSGSTLLDFDLRNAQAASTGGGSQGIYLRDCSDVEMVGLDVHTDIHSGVPYPESGAQGIFSSGPSSNCRAWYCRFWMNGQSFPSDHSWYMEGVGHWMIGCLVVRHDWGYGMQAYHGGSATDPSNCRIVACTFVGSKKSSITLYGTGNKAINCICMDNAEYGARIDRPGNEIRDTIVWDPATTYNPGGGTFTRVAAMDPKLANAYALVDDAHPPVLANYKPLTGSPAIGKADPEFCPPLLLDGTPRTSADLGCL